MGVDFARSRSVGGCLLYIQCLKYIRLYTRQVSISYTESVGIERAYIARAEPISNGMIIATPVGTVGVEDTYILSHTHPKGSYVLVTL